MLTTVIGDAAARSAAVFAFGGRRIVRDLKGLPETLAWAGSLELKLAVTRPEIRAVQKMRYRVFFEEGHALADPFTRAQRRDNCPFDRVCDHIIVIDHNFVSGAGRRKPRVVGAYRVLRQDVIGSPARFYSAGEFDVAGMIARHPDKRFLELGRSCVLPEYRARRVLELLWRGLWAYVRHHRIDAMFGCASLPGTNLADHAESLAFLRAYAPAGEDWRVTASGAGGLITTPERRPPQDSSRERRRAMASLPPLIKGYLRAGARFSDSVFVDRAFGVTDVFVVMPVAEIDARYVEHFGGPPMDRAAA